MFYLFSLTQAKIEPYPGTTSATQIPDPVPRRKALYTDIVLAESSQLKYWHCHLGTCQGTTDTTLSLARLHFLHQQNGNHDNTYCIGCFSQRALLCPFLSMVYWVLAYLRPCVKILKESGECNTHLGNLHSSYWATDVSFIFFPLNSNEFSRFWQNTGLLLPLQKKNS